MPNFIATVLGVESTMDVAIAAEDDVELRRLTVTNRTLRKRQLELTSYVELSLAPHRADVAHPAFAKMFVETEAVSEDTLIAHRRARSPEDPPIWVAHLLIGASSGIQHETDRAIFLGRGNNVSSPDKLRQDLSGSTGAVLDPIFSLRCSLDLEARDRVEITYITLTAASRESLMALVEKYKRPESIARAFQMAWTRAQLEFRYLGIDPSAAHRFQELASHLIYPNARLRPPSDRLALNKLGQPALWGYGVSGDLPMLVVTIADARGLPLLRELLLAHNYWRLRGFRVDLIVLNQETASYEQPLKTQLLRQIEAHSTESGIDKPGGVFLRDWNAIPEDHRNLFLSTASVVLSGGRGSLKQQLSGASEPAPSAAFVRSGSVQEQVSTAVAVSRTAILQRARRLHSGWQRVRDLFEARQPYSVRLGQRDGESNVRSDGERERTRLHLERQQPSQSPHAVAQRSRDRSAIGGDLYSRRRDRRYLDADPFAGARK